MGCEGYVWLVCVSRGVACGIRASSRSGRALVVNEIARRSRRRPAGPNRWRDVHLGLAGKGEAGLVCSAPFRTLVRLSLRLPSFTARRSEPRSAGFSWSSTTPGREQRPGGRDDEHVRQGAAWRPEHILPSRHGREAIAVAREALLVMPRRAGLPGAPLSADATSTRVAETAEPVMTPEPASRSDAAIVVAPAVRRRNQPGPAGARSRLFHPIESVLLPVPYP